MPRKQLFGKFGKAKKKDNTTAGFGSLNDNDDCTLPSESHSSIDPTQEIITTLDGRNPRAFDKKSESNHNVVFEQEELERCYSTKIDSKAVRTLKSLHMIPPTPTACTYAHVGTMASLPSQDFPLVQELQSKLSQSELACQKLLSENADLQSAVQDIQPTIRGLKEKNEVLVKQLFEKEEKLEYLQYKKEQQDKLQSLIKSLSDEEKQLKANIQELFDQKKQLEVKVNEASEEEKYILNKIKQNTDKENMLQCNIKECSDTKFSLQMRIKELSAEESKIKTIIKGMAEERNKLILEIQKMEKQESDLQCKIQQLDDHKQMLDANIQKVTDQEQATVCSMLKLSNEETELTVKLKELKDKEQQLKTNITKLSDEEKQLQAKVKSLHNQEEHHQFTINELTAKHGSLQSNIQELQAKERDLLKRTKMTPLTTKLRSFEEFLLMEGTAEPKQTINQMEKTIEVLEKELEAVNIQLSQAKSGKLSEDPSNVGSAQLSLFRGERDAAQVVARAASTKVEKLRTKLKEALEEREFFRALVIGCCRRACRLLTHVVQECNLHLDVEVENTKDLYLQGEVKSSISEQDVITICDYLGLRQQYNDVVLELECLRNKYTVNKILLLEEQRSNEKLLIKARTFQAQTRHIRTQYTDKHDVCDEGVVRMSAMGDVQNSLPSAHEGPADSDQFHSPHE